MAAMRVAWVPLRGMLKGMAPKGRAIFGARQAFSGRWPAGLPHDFVARRMLSVGTDRACGRRPSLICHRAEAAECRSGGPIAPGAPGTKDPRPTRGVDPITGVATPAASETSVPGGRKRHAIGWKRAPRTWHYCRRWSTVVTDPARGFQGFRGCRWRQQARVPHSCRRSALQHLPLP